MADLNTPLSMRRRSQADATYDRRFSYLQMRVAKAEPEIRSLDAAATSLQSRVRRLLMRMRFVKAICAQTIIAACARGHHVRQELRQMKRSAAYIQARYRDHKSRRERSNLTAWQRDAMNAVRQRQQITKKGNGGADARGERRIS